MPEQAVKDAYWGSKNDEHKKVIYDYFSQHKQNHGIEIIRDYKLNLLLTE